MAYSYDSLITVLWDRYDEANVHRAEIFTKRDQALYDWNAADDHKAIRHLIEGLDACGSYAVDMLARGFYGYDGSDYALLCALDRSFANEFITEAPEFELTMSAILSRMVSASFSEFQAFIGYIDGYRVALWNKPFNSDYYAALARGFME